jgi:hypothetical protein
MIDKRKLVDTIEKYYLNGLTEAVKFNIKNNVLTIPFSTTNRNVEGKVTLPIELPNAEFGIFETTPFLKLLHILDTNIEIQYQEKFGIVEKLLIEDNQYKMMFSVSDISLIPKTPNAFDPFKPYTDDKSLGRKSPMTTITRPPKPKTGSMV